MTLGFRVPLSAICDGGSEQGLWQQVSCLFSKLLPPKFQKIDPQNDWLWDLRGLSYGSFPLFPMKNQGVNPKPRQPQTLHPKP